MNDVRWAGRWPAATAVVASGLIIACTGAPAPTGAPPTSTASTAPFVVAAEASVATLENTAYISLPPDAIPTGVSAAITDVRTGISVTATMVDGGFDPVALPAAVGDTVAIAIRTTGAPLSFVLALPASDPPIVVRTDPPPHKRDVPLNASMAVVFSEPIDPATLAGASVQLLSGTNAVSGQLVFSDGDHTTVVFEPAAPLTANTDYQLVVDSGILDLHGDPLSASLSVPFTTGASTTTGATSVAVSPSSVTMAAGTTLQFTAVVKDAAGNALSGSAVTWTVSSPAVATVSASGVVTAVAAGAVFVSAASGGQTGTANITVTAPIVVTLPADTTSSPTTQIVFASITTGGSHTCGLSTTGAAYCWGDNSYGQLGHGTTTGTKVCGDYSGVHYCTPTPVAVAGGLTFASLSAGGAHTCGVTTAGAAYCWGASVYGDLGDGTTDARSTPTPVAGGLAFATISAGDFTTCGVTVAGAAYCWGYGWDGELGADSATFESHCPPGQATYCPVPVPVSGGLVFASLSIADGDTCGLAVGGNTYCWGAGGGLGIATTTGPPFCLDDNGNPTTDLCSHVPVAVTGAPVFQQLTAGFCGLTPQGAAYCWGGNIGDGTTAGSLVPVPGGGGRTFTTLGSGGNQTCGVTPGGAAYCWGEGGALGDGTTVDRASPVAVAGGLVFKMVSAGKATISNGNHACGVTSAGVAYCWGDNSDGQLGIGSTPAASGTVTTARSNVPVKVSGQP